MEAGPSWAPAVCKETADVMFELRRSWLCKTLYCSACCFEGRALFAPSLSDVAFTMSRNWAALTAGKSRSGGLAIPELASILGCCELVRNLESVFALLTPPARCFSDLSSSASGGNNSRLDSNFGLAYSFCWAYYLSFDTAAGSDAPVLLSSAFAFH